MIITAMLSRHWEAVKTIYEQGIATGQATFETEAPSWEKWNDRAYRASPARGHASK